MLSALLAALAIIPVSNDVRPGGPISVTTAAETLTVGWADETGRPWTAVFNLDSAKRLLARVGHSKPVIENARPMYWVNTGKRRGGWDQFFDFPGSHPEGTRRFEHTMTPTKATVRSVGNRVEVRFEGLKMGIFSGSIAYTFFPGSRLVMQEAIVSTREPDTAFFYDAGLQWDAPYDRRPGANMQTRIAWYDTSGKLHNDTMPFFSSERQPLSARYRTVATATPGGSIAVFPAPHQYFMPRDFTSNLGFVWAHSFRGQVALGTRQLPDEHWIFYPWMNAPPDTEQRLSLFLLLSPDQPAKALDDVLAFTHRDRFPAVPGYRTMTSHWHFAYTEQAEAYGEQWTPPFKPVLLDHGIDMAMIADFHGDGHPRDTGALRIKELKDYFRFCRVQSNSKFLMIPAEEANVHFGGHYILAFPKPVYWYMSRAAGQPFQEGEVYRTKDAQDLLELVRRENGLVYTAHPRTKGSLEFPDKYKDSAFFRDGHFIGAGWKQMPSNLSEKRLGLRALNLVDDLLNWGFAKKLVAEVDVFQLDATHDLYPHLNANYVRLAQIPTFDQYGAVLDALRKGDYFSSTGEVTLPKVDIKPGLKITADIQWTFPLEHAVIVWGDQSNQTHREFRSLRDRGTFGKQSFTFEIPASGARWARVEVWDVASNGAFTPPVIF